uniref:Uncharacterized protein n=1 Tax=Rhizophora mucronata TaxID=61149 RepID=A0A2P2QZC6_RHIMU
MYVQLYDCLNECQSLVLLLFVYVEV